MDKIFEIHPKRPISGILPDMKRIMEVTRMPLSKAEFLRCMNAATLYAIVENDKILVTSLDYEKALSLFDIHADYKDKSMKDVNLEFAAQPVNDERIEHKAEEMIKAVADSSTPLPVEIVNKEESTEDPVTEEKPEEAEEKATEEEEKIEESVEEEEETILANATEEVSEEELVEEPKIDDTTTEESAAEDAPMEEEKTEEKKDVKPQQKQNNNKKPDLAKNFNNAKKGNRRK